MSIDMSLIADAGKAGISSPWPFSGFPNDSGERERKAQSQPQSTATFRLILEELLGEAPGFISFCPFEWQTKLFAVASPASSTLLIYKVSLDTLECGEDCTTSQLVCKFHLTGDGHITDLSWSPRTSINIPAKVELLVALSSGVVCSCLWDGDVTGSAAGGLSSVKKLTKHDGGGVSVHIAPFVEASAASVGADNVLNVYSMQPTWSIREQRRLRTAGKFVRFIGKELFVLELDGTLRMYETDSIRPMRVSLYKAALPLRVDSTKDILATIQGTGELRVFDLPLRGPARLSCEAACGSSAGGPCVCIAISPLKPWIALADVAGFSIRHIETGALIQRSRTRYAVHHLCWHPELPLLAVACGGQVQLFMLQ